MYICTVNCVLCVDRMAQNSWVTYLLTLCIVPISLEWSRMSPQRRSCLDFSGLHSILSYAYGHRKVIGHDRSGRDT
jgi:hypothetical protein